MNPISMIVSPDAKLRGTIRDELQEIADVFEFDAIQESLDLLKLLGNRTKLIFFDCDWPDDPEAHIEISEYRRISPVSELVAITRSRANTIQCRQVMKDGAYSYVSGPFAHGQFKAIAIKVFQENTALHQLESLISNNFIAHYSARITVMHELISVRRAKGTTLTIEDIRLFLNTSETHAQLSHAGPQHTDKDYKKILVVEDDTAMASEISMMLSHQNYVPVVCSTGTQAVSHVADPSIGLVLLDIGLPDIDGLSLSEVFRRQRPDLIIVILTAENRLDYMIRGFKNHIYDYLTKPVSWETLFNTLSRGLQHQIFKAALRDEKNKKILTESVPYQKRIMLFSELLSYRESIGKPTLHHELSIFFPELTTDQSPHDQNEINPNWLKDDLPTLLYQLESQKIGMVRPD